MGRPKGYDRDEVLRRATNLFWDKGYEGTHLRELIKVTEISRFSLYKEFGGKEGLFQEALAAYLEKLADMGKIFVREPQGLQNIRDFFQALVDFGFRHGCFAVNTIHEKFVAPEPAYMAVLKQLEAEEEQFVVNLRAARDAGEIGPDIDIEGLSKLLSTVNIGMLTYGIVSPGREEAERIVDSLERLWS